MADDAAFVDHFSRNYGRRYFGTHADPKVAMLVGGKPGRAKVTFDRTANAFIIEANGRRRSVSYETIQDTPKEIPGEYILNAHAIILARVTNAFDAVARDMLDHVGQSAYFGSVFNGNR